ncbi:hypothetical protein LWI28_029071 [Acer negundo]|uniref:Uncharacterized protein n=1 Tax=Acer negundo TaxID=4023 RepID=A0AAD5IK21_ACENE|nr:hypothetical protein LWI28_029071 [Acer negundo]
MLAATAEVAVMARAMDEAAALAVVAVKPVDKSADELDKELDKYHAEAMQTWRTFVACDSAVPVGAGLNTPIMKQSFPSKPSLVSGFPKRAQIKEKGIIINNDAGIRSVAQNGQLNMVVDKGKIVERSWSTEDSGESTFEARGDGFWLQGINFGGESSKASMDNSVCSNIIIDLSKDGGSGKEMGHTFKEALLKGGPGLLQQNENLEVQSFRDEEFEKEVSSEVSLSSFDNSVSHVSETQQLEGVNLVASGIVNSYGRLKNVSSKKVSKPTTYVKRHGMKTRKDRRLISQGLEDLRKGISSSYLGKGCRNLDVELSKVIEKGVELGFLKFPNSGDKGGVDNEERDDNLAVAWSLSEEVAKVIETGVALRFDFSGRMDKNAAEISRREKEDEERFLATK